MEIIVQKSPRHAGEAQRSFNPSLNVVLLISVNTFSTTPQAKPDFRADTGFESIPVPGAEGGRSQQAVRAGGAGEHASDR